jgi:hypothetical protein
VDGVDTRHTVNTVVRATPSADDPTIELDDQHDAYRILESPDPTLHEYVREYVSTHNLL